MKITHTHRRFHADTSVCSLQTCVRQPQFKHNYLCMIREMILNIAFKYATTTSQRTPFKKKHTNLNMLLTFAKYSIPIFPMPLQTYHFRLS